MLLVLPELTFSKSGLCRDTEGLTSASPGTRHHAYRGVARETNQFYMVLPKVLVV